MKKRILASRILIASFVALLIASSLSLPASALIQYLEEGSSQWSGSGTQWDITGTGRGNHAYQYLSHIESNDYIGANSRAEAIVWARERSLE